MCSSILSPNHNLQGMICLLTAHWGGVERELSRVLLLQGRRSLYAIKVAQGRVCDGAGFRHEASILPFELHVLEVAIGDVCQLCSGLVKELESSGHPILDTLVKHVRPTL